MSYWATILELTWRTLVSTPISAINLLYDLKQVIIFLQMIFKLPLSPDPSLFSVSLLLSPWSNLNRSNLVLTKSLCSDAACSLFGWTQCLPLFGDAWVVLMECVRGKGILPGGVAQERQMRFIAGSHCNDGEKPVCLLQCLSWAEQAQRNQYLIVDSVCNVSASSAPGIPVCKGSQRPEEASSCMWAGSELGCSAQLAPCPVPPACGNLLSLAMFTPRWRKRARWVLFAVLNALRLLPHQTLWGSNYFHTVPIFQMRCWGREKPQC